MSRVPAPLAEWLRSQELMEVGKDAGVIDKWSTLAIDAGLSSPLAERGAAAAEAARQLAFHGRALAVEVLAVRGRLSQLAGQSRRVVADAEGYRDAPSVFIIGAEEQTGGITQLTVLRRLEVY